MTIQPEDFNELETGSVPQNGLQENMRGNIFFLTLPTKALH